MSIETNKDIVRRVTAALNQRDWNTLQELMAPELASGMQNSPFLQAFPDVLIITEGMIAEGDYVASWWRDEGTHLGEYAGLQATNKRFSVSGMSVDRIENGKVVETRISFDDIGLLRQLGVTQLPQ